MFSLGCLGLGFVGFRHEQLDFKSQLRFTDVRLSVFGGVKQQSGYDFEEAQVMI